jgi:hypothetical protein
MRILGVSFIFLAAASFAMATETTVPELDANSAAAAVALLSGGYFIARARRKR